MFRLRNKLFLILVLCFSLLGCANNPAMLGVGSLEWESYSQEKQKNLLDSYSKFAKDRKMAVRKSADEISDKIFLEVSIHDGKIMFPPAFINWQKYQPVKFNIFKGQCKDIEVMSQNGGKYKSKIEVCFYDKILYLDPSHYDLTKKEGSIGIHFSPLWITGFAYKGINSAGYVRFNNVTVEIKQEKIAEVKDKN